jgi:hypothetical protein
MFRKLITIAAIFVLPNQLIAWEAKTFEGDVNVVYEAKAVQATMTNSLLGDGERSTQTDLKINVICSPPFAERFGKVEFPAISIATTVALNDYFFTSALGSPMIQLSFQAGQKSSTHIVEGNTTMALQNLMPFGTINATSLEIEAFKREVGMTSSFLAVLGTSAPVMTMTISTFETPTNLSKPQATYTVNLDPSGARAAALEISQKCGNPLLPADPSFGR